MNKKHRILVPLLLLAFFFRPAPGLAATLTLPKSDALIKGYFASPETNRTAFLASFGENDRIALPADARKMAEAFLREAAKQKPVLQTSSVDITDKLSAERKQFNKSQGLGKAPITEIKTPNGIMRAIILESKKPAKTSALIYLHGGGNGSDENEMAWGWGLLRVPKIKSIPFAVIPRCVSDATVNSWVQHQEAQNVETVLSEILRHYNVDPDRVYLMGISMGGFGAWQFASYSGDRFAGIASNGGGSTLQGNAHRNLRNVNFAVFIGQDDKTADRIGYARKGRDAIEALKTKDQTGFPFQYKEYPGVSHNAPDSMYDDMDKYFATVKRISYPRIVDWSPQVEWKKRFYNIAIASPGKGMQIRAEMGTNNLVRLTSENVPAMTLYLNDSLVNMDKPVTVEWNGKSVYQGTVPRRLSVLMETLAERYDIGMFYTGKIPLTQP